MKLAGLFLGFITAMFWWHGVKEFVNRLALIEQGPEYDVWGQPKSLIKKRLIIANLVMGFIGLLLIKWTLSLLGADDFSGDYNKPKPSNNSLARPAQTQLIDNQPVKNYSVDSVTNTQPVNNTPTTWVYDKEMHLLSGLTQPKILDKDNQTALNAAELAYCLAERFRLNYAEDKLKFKTNNKLKDDSDDLYLRCANRDFDENDMSKAKRFIEQFNDVLIKQALNRVEDYRLR